MNLKPDILIVSVFQTAKTESENQSAHNKVLTVLKSEGIPCIELLGRYNGVNEKSILLEGFENRRLVERLAKEFNQECYLESHNDRATFLVYQDGTRQSIGTLTAVSQDEAEQAIGYSYNPITKQHFITK